ncbi:MAG: hypothetical protein NXI31_15070 [bacterium]|nr:hypothetical protein [bacterium]
MLHCQHFGRCGGCSALDVEIATQLDRKRARARDLLQDHLGGIEPEITLPPRPPRHDRTAILYPVQPRGKDLTLGIYRRGSHVVEAITDCRIQHKALTALGTRAGEAFRKLRLPPYDERDHSGIVRAFRARVMPGTNELLLGAIVTRRQFPERERLAEILWRAAQGLRDDQGRELQPVGVVININDRPGNVLLGPTSLVPRGRDHQFDEQQGLRFRVSFGSFYQQNRYSDAVLFRPALAMLGDVTGQSVIDGYGGVGTFALRLRQAGAASVTIIESSPSACDDARFNLAASGGDPDDVREEEFGKHALPPADLLVADPPRAGLGEPGAAAILGAMPDRVLLVSCALESLARDLARLVPNYRVTALRLCDLFPHTDHVEALTLLERA